MFETSTFTDECFTEQGRHGTEHDTKPQRVYK